MHGRACLAQVLGFNTQLNKAFLRFLAMASDYTWLAYALLSAIFAALVAIFGKVGLQGPDSAKAPAALIVIGEIFVARA